MLSDIFRRPFSFGNWAARTPRGRGGVLGVLGEFWGFFRGFARFFWLVKGEGFLGGLGVHGTVGSLAKPYKNEV